jgi:uncharacterized protein DUF4349
MRLHLRAVPSFFASAYSAIPSRARLALAALALLGVVAVTGSALLERLPFSGRMPGRPQIEMKDEGQTRPRSVAAFREGLPPSSEPVANPGDVMSGGWGRRIARRANLEVELADVDAGVARLTSIVESLGGFVGSTDSLSDPRGTSRATVTAYVPPAEFSRALAGFDGVGRVTRRTIGGQDVSEEFVDLEARLRNFERHEAQLLSFMGKAQKVPDLLALESELARVRGEIEQATGRLRFLKARTDLATIQVALVRAPFLAPPDGLFGRLVEQVKQAFAEGWTMAFTVALGVAVLAAQLSPLAIFALAGWLIYRRWAGRRSHVTPSS